MSKGHITWEQFKELIKNIDKEKLRKIAEEAEKCRNTIESSLPYNPIRVSDLTVTDFSRMLRDIVREEIKESLSVPRYEGWFEVPNTPGEINKGDVRTYATDRTVFESDKFPRWGHGYREI